MTPTSDTSTPRWPCTSRPPPDCCVQTRTSRRSPRPAFRRPARRGLLPRDESSLLCFGRPFFPHSVPSLRARRSHGLGGAGRLDAPRSAPHTVLLACAPAPTHSPLAHWPASTPRREAPRCSETRRTVIQLGALLLEIAHCSETQRAALRHGACPSRMPRCSGTRRAINPTRRAALRDRALLFEIARAPHRALLTDSAHCLGTWHGALGLNGRLSESAGCCRAWRVAVWTWRASPAHHTRLSDDMLRADPDILVVT